MVANRPFSPWLLIFRLILLLCFSDYAFALELGEETAIPNEERITNRLAQGTLGLLSRLSSTRDEAKRGLHPKSHGCPLATFTVLNDLPEEYQVGLFAQPKEYNALVRFSNGMPLSLPDAVPDVRGMAVKLLGVYGAKAMGNATTQDFLMVDDPRFFMRDIRGFNGIGFLFNVVGSATMPSSVLSQTYWSQVPSKFGDATAMKFRARPCDANDGSRASVFNPNRLQAGLSRDLANGEQCFLFEVQLQRDAESMPIEDARVEWLESESPFVTVAKIRLLQQDINDEALAVYCEGLSFNPWHSLEAHRPLGNISRARRVIYEKGARDRRESNGVWVGEPEGDEFQFGAVID